MTAAQSRAPLSVYMLADHLDAALAAGEDLVARGHDWRHLAGAPGNIQTFPARQREIVEAIRSFELMAIARLLKARDHAAALAKAEERFAAVAGLFVSGTAILLDAVDECGDATAMDFDTGDSVVAYARTRGLISAEAPAVSNAAQLTIDDTFLVARKIQLGGLMDLAASFLDALELHYDLFPVDDSIRRPFVKADEPPAPEVKRSSRLPSKSAFTRFAKGLDPRREFGQRQRTPLN